MKKFATTTLFALCSLLVAATAFATPPCEDGSNANCSWSCSGGVFNVTCDNPQGPDRCYIVQDGTTCSSPCADFNCYSVVPYNPMEGPAAAATPDRTVSGELSNTDAPPPAPAPVAPLQRRR